MQRLSFVFSLTAAAVLLSGCFLPGLVTMAGSAGTAIRPYDFSDFDQVSAANAFEVIITQGNDYSVVVSVNENFEQYLQVTQSGRRLNLSLEPGRSYSNTNLKAEITMPALTGLNLSGASRAWFSGFDAGQDLRLEVSGASDAEGDITAGRTWLEASGAGRIDLSGAAERLDLRISGASQANLADFAVSGDARVDASGASRADVNVAGLLDVSASGASSVRYAGGATLGDIDTSGGSSVQRK